MRHGVLLLGDTDVGIGALVLVAPVGEEGKMEEILKSRTALMGSFSIEIGIGDIRQEQWVTIDALVEPGRS